MKRAAAAVASAALVLLVSGCRVTGTVVVNGDDTVTVDLTQQIATASGLSCTEEWAALSSLQVDIAVTDAGSTCHVHGTASFAEASKTVLDLQHVGGYYVASAHSYSTDGEQSADVEVTMPGTVLARSGGTLNGNTIRWTGPPDEAAWPSGWAVSRAAGTPDARVLYGVGGVLLGGAAAALLRRLVGRPRRPPSDPPKSPGPPSSGPRRTRRRIPLPPQDPSVWAPRPGEDGP